MITSMSAILVSWLIAAAAAVLPVQQPPADEAVELTPPGGKVSGTLLVPSASGKVPVVLMIAGSGPTDRDGNSKALPGLNNSTRLLAEALAANGIASLRYDKRGIGRSVFSGLKESDLRFETFVDDASGWIATLRADNRFSTITVVGHSEGSLIGMIAARVAKADAFVSIAGVARGAAAILRDQLRPQLAASSKLWEESERVLSGLEAGKTTDPVPAELVMLYRPSVQPYLISWFKYTPSAEIARLTIPVLIVQGTTDIQVTVDEAKALKAALPSAQLDIVEGMNHVLKMVPADRAKQLASYSDPSLAVAPELPKAIVGFIHEVRKTQ